MPPAALRTLEGLEGRNCRHEIIVASHGAYFWPVMEVQDYRPSRSKISKPSLRLLQMANDLRSLMSYGELSLCILTVLVGRGFAVIFIKSKRPIIGWIIASVSGPRGCPDEY